MIKRISGCFFAILFCLCFSTSALYAQDSTATRQPEAPKPIVTKPAETTPVKTTLVKPVRHYYRKYTPPAVNPVQTADTTKAGITAAPTEPAQPTDKSLNGQYQYLLTKIYHYQQPLLAALWKNAIDTLNANRAQLKDAKAKLALQSKLTDSLKKTAADQQQSTTQAEERVDAISLFGILLTKSSYNLVMVGLVSLLAVALIVVILSTSRHKKEAKYRTELYEEIEEDFKTFKAKAHEKELKLARELQTERNKVDELLGRG